MSKFAKYSILLGLALIFIAIIFSFRDLDRLWESFNINIGYTTSEYIATEEINAVYVNTYNMRVEIRRFNGDNIKVTYSSPERGPITINENNGILSLNRETSRPRIQIFNVNFNFRVPDILIEVPGDLIIRYNITTTNARITVYDTEMLESNFRTSNSSISLTNVHSNYLLDLRSNNGRINLDEVNSEKVVANTSNSRINAVGVITSDISLTSSNGNIFASDIVSENVNLTTSNSRITLNNLRGTNIDLRTSNGRIEGSIIGNPEDFRREMRTSNGRININGNNHGTVINDFGDAEQSIRAHTSNSSINLNFR